MNWHMADQFFCVLWARLCVLQEDLISKAVFELQVDTAIHVGTIMRVCSGDEFRMFQDRKSVV